MIIKEKLKPYLETLAEKHPWAVMGKLEKGSRVKKSWGLSYEIDDTEIDSRLGDFPKGTLPYGPIHKTLKNFPQKILKLFNGTSEAPFSRAYEEGVGECLEKAILVQLSSQRRGESFLINGALSQIGGFDEAHAYNVVFKNDKPFLVDAQNPLAKDLEENITHPYIAPILGIKEGSGDFVVPKEWVQNRRYSIF